MYETREQKAKRLHVEPDMVLPDGKTCRDCSRFRSCASFLGVRIETWEHCDWSPAAFIPRAAVNA